MSKRTQSFDKLYVRRHAISNQPEQIYDDDRFAFIFADEYRRIAIPDNPTNECRSILISKRNNINRKGGGILASAGKNCSTVAITRRSSSPFFISVSSALISARWARVGRTRRRRPDFWNCRAKVQVHVEMFRGEAAFERAPCLLPRQAGCREFLQRFSRCASPLRINRLFVLRTNNRLEVDVKIRVGLGIQEKAE